jgi:hypothetical protein
MTISNIKSATAKIECQVLFNGERRTEERKKGGRKTENGERKKGKRKKEKGKW